MFDIKGIAGDLISKHVDLPIDDLFNSDFIKNNSTFSSITELVKKFNPDFEPKDIITLIGNGEFDSFIGENTKFGNFAEMLEKAKDLLGK